MKGITGDLYYSSSGTFTSWDDMTFIKRINMSVGESAYTVSEIQSHFYNTRLFDQGQLNNQVASDLDEYVPNWEAAFVPCYAAPSFSGVEKYAPYTYLRFFPACDDISNILLDNTGYLFVRLADNDYLKYEIGTNGSILMDPAINGYENSHFHNGIEVYPFQTAKGDAWDGTTNNGVFQIRGGFPVICSNGYTCFSLTIYDTARPTVTVGFTTEIGAYEQALDKYVNLLEDNWKPELITDPYDQGGQTGTGGGTGTFSDTGDAIDFPGLPSLSAVDTGFITLFNPSLSQLQNLAHYMWSGLFDIATWKKIFADPMQAILGLSIVPVDVPSTNGRVVTVGNISTNVLMNVADTQYVEVDCGTLNIQEYWGAYLDYSPYTKCYIYLPYIGTHPISVDDVMGKAVHIKYHIDILSGACTAYVKCGDSVMYEFIGQCSSSIPITGDNWTNVINGVLSIAGAVGTMVATGGFSAPATLASAPAIAGMARSDMYTAGHAGMAAASLGQDVMSMKQQVEKSGAMSGTGGMLAIQKPYMILERPRQAVPANQNKFIGYPSYITRKLGDLSGYTEVESIHLESIPCYGEERAEIDSLLKGGVII